MLLNDQLKVGIADAEPKLFVPPVTPVAGDRAKILVAWPVLQSPPIRVACAPPAQTIVIPLAAEKP